MNLRQVILYGSVMIGALFVFTPFSLAQEPEKIQEFVVGDPLPPVVDLMLVGSKGESLNLAPRAGHPYLLHIWATWCPPCRVELPHLDHFLQKNPDAPVIPLVMDSGSPLKVAAFLERMGMKNVPVWIADRQKLRDLVKKIPNPGLPMTLLIDDTGHIRGVSDGDLDWGADDAPDQLHILLERTQNLSHDKPILKDGGDEIRGDRNGEE